MTRSEVRPAQFASPAGPPEVIQAPPAQAYAARAADSRLFSQRRAHAVQMDSDPRGGNLWIAVIDAGVNMVIDNVDVLGSIDISTDRLVIWTVNPGRTARS